MTPEAVQWPQAWLSVPRCRPKVLLGISLEGLVAGERWCRVGRWQTDPPRTLSHEPEQFVKIFLCVWCSAFIEIEISAALKTKIENHCSFWKKWLHNGRKVTGLGEGLGRLLPQMWPRGASAYSVLLCVRLADLVGEETGLLSALQKGYWCFQPIRERLCLHVSQQEQY